MSLILKLINWTHYKKWGCSSNHSFIEDMKKLFDEFLLGIKPFTAKKANKSHILD